MASTLTIAPVSPESAASAAVLPTSARLWLNVLSHLDPSYGGLSSIVPQLCISVAETGLASASIAAFCLPGEQIKPVCLPPETTSFWPTGRIEWLSKRDLRRNFTRAVDKVEGLHIHGLFERRNLDGAACLHALTRAEAEDYRHFGCTNPIVVIPNAVHIPAALDPDLFLSAYPLLRGKTLILFLGRIHFKKGLDLLVSAWAELARKWPEARLVLAGPDSENTRAGIEQRIAEAGIADRVTFTGMLDSDMKWSAYAAAACFVLPSYSEGLSTSVLEAMAAGLPIVLTEQSHMPEVSEHQAGWTIQPRVDDLIDALTAALSASIGERQQIGSRGRTLVKHNYSWPSVARRMGEVYRWLGGGPLPESMHSQIESRS
jgi:glycosyltransferase involved in cell wall biosynthesis